MQGNPSYAIPRDYKSRLSRYLMSLDFCYRWIAIASRLPRIESSHFWHFDHSPGCGCLRIPASDYSLVVRLNFTYSAGGRVHLCDSFRDFNSNPPKTLYQSALIHARKQWRRSLWDRGDVSPQYLLWWEHAYQCPPNIWGFLFLKHQYLAAT